MYEILEGGGFTTGGVNFDAKVRRTSFEPADLFYAHIAGMDSFAIGLKVAAKLIEDKALQKYVDDRYASFKEGIGAEIAARKVDFKKLEQYALQNNPIVHKSGRIEVLRSIVNQYLLNA
jgi:xylose isomerase